MPFVILVIVGQNLITNGLKEVFDRLRPTINPIAETLGPSFPSGHSATAAAFYAAAALVLGRRRSPRVRVRCWRARPSSSRCHVAGTRVMLGVHWLSDVIGGLLLGWAWFAVAAIAFGGRLLRFGAAAEHVSDAAQGTARVPARGRRRGRAALTRPPPVSDSSGQRPRRLVPTEGRR